MKKVLYVTTVSLTLNTFFIPHIKHLINNGHEVQVASNIDVELSDDFESMGVIHHKIDFSRNPISLENRLAFKQIKELQRKEQFNIIHVHTPVASFITRLALKDEEVKIIYTAHGFHFYKGAPILNWILYYPLERLAANWTDTLVTINSEDFNRAKEFKLRNNGEIKLMHGVGIEKNKYKIENFDSDNFKKSLGLDKNDFAILILAELNKNKNHIQIINAMKLLSNKYKNIKVLCAGKGNLESELKSKVRSLGLEENILFLGFRTDVKELLYSCDCVALFSKREGLGKCLLEGMIFEKPIIATNTRGPKELIEHNINGFLIDVGDYKKTANLIEEIYINKNKRKIFVENSNKKLNKYLQENVLKQLVTYY